MLYFKVFHEIDEVESQWHTLIEASGTKNIFLNYYWIRNWVKSYANNIEKLHLIVVFDNKKCVAISPFYVSSFHPKTLSLIGTNEPEQCEVNAEGMDVIYLTQYKEELLSYLVYIIEKHVNANCIVIKNIIEFSFIHRITEQLSRSKFSREFEPCYQFIFNQFDNIKSTLDTHKKNKRTLNKFTKDELCIFEVADNAYSKQEFFDVLIKLHQKRWKQKGKQGVFDNPVFLDFHRSLLLDANFAKFVLLSAIKYNQEIISVNYSFCFKDKIYFYQAGINSAFKPNFSPGLLNHLLLINHGRNIRTKEYNLLLSNDKNSYKNELSNHQTKLISVEIYKYNLSNLFKIIRLKLTPKANIKI